MLRPSRLSLNELRLQCVGEPRYDFVLHFKQIGDGLIEAFGPEVSSGFGINKLHVHPEPVVATLHGAFEHVADVSSSAARACRTILRSFGRSPYQTALKSARSGIAMANLHRSPC